MAALAVSPLVSGLVAAVALLEAEPEAVRERAKRDQVEMAAAVHRHHLLHHLRTTDTSGALAPRSRIAPLRTAVNVDTV